MLARLHWDQVLVAIHMTLMWHPDPVVYENTSES
jgi:hypothetical protein